MEPNREQPYRRRIAELESQLRQRDERIAALERQVAELTATDSQALEELVKLIQAAVERHRQAAEG